MEPVLVREEGVCRICGDPAWSRDDTGFVHLCCARVGIAPCPACVTSKALNRTHRREIREPLVDEAEPEPRQGYSFGCGRCGRHSGLYATRQTCEEELAAHQAHRCPGPWLLDADTEIPTVWDSKLVTSADTRATQAIRQDDETRGRLSPVDRSGLR